MRKAPRYGARRSKKNARMRPRREYARFAMRYCARVMHQSLLIALA
nr:MAG TPA: hypothetical protein [Caudoviricetes sp.]